jgi:triphosphoribosyl-dephospho-CoA synthase
MRTPAENAQLALLLEVAGTPKPGNVDRRRDLPDLRFEHFLAGTIGAGAGLRAAGEGASVGEAFETAVAGMADQSGGNTQFGALLLLVPLVATAADGELTGDAVRSVVDATTVEDAADFYRAFDHVAVSVDDPPANTDVPDVRRGADAVADVEAAGLTLRDVMAAAADRDDVAREWVEGFERSFAAADRIAARSGPVPGRVAETFLWLLSRRPDTHVATTHGDRVARRVMVRAQSARDRGHVEAFADALVEEGINPGTTADVVAAGCFVALERDGIEI